MKKSTCYLIVSLLTLFVMVVYGYIGVDITGISAASFVMFGMWGSEALFETWNEKDDGPK